MLILALLLAAQIASPPVPKELPRHTAERDCWGGRFLFFKRGSDELEDEYLSILRDWSHSVGEAKEEGHIEVEAGGDGAGPAFNAGLSRRRVERLERALGDNGLARFPVEVRPVFLSPDRNPDPDPRSEDEKGRYAHVRLMVREASEFLGGAGGLARECW